MKKGFTLIELLVVIGIISILATVVFVALNPVERFTDAKTARRTNDVTNLLTAVSECIIDNKGNLTPCVGTLTNDRVYEIVNEGVVTGCLTNCGETIDEAHCAAIQSELASYLKKLPVDPDGVAADHTGYAISKDANSLITIVSCAEPAVEASR